MADVRLVLLILPHTHGNEGSPDGICYMPRHGVSFQLSTFHSMEMDERRFGVECHFPTLARIFAGIFDGKKK